MEISKSIELFSRGSAVGGGVMCFTKRADAIAWFKHREDDSTEVTLISKKWPGSPGLATYFVGTPDQLAAQRIEALQAA